MTFREVIQIGKVTSEVTVSDDIVTELGTGKRTPVTVTVHHRTTIAPLGGQN